MTQPLFNANTPVTDEVLNVIAHLPTRSLASVASEDFFRKLSDANCMRIAVLLAQKGYEEGGCPIGGVIISNETRQILGKGHNTLAQETILTITVKLRRFVMQDAGISARRRSSRH